MKSVSVCLHFTWTLYHTIINSFINFYWGLFLWCDNHMYQLPKFPNKAIAYSYYSKHSLAILTGT